MKKYKIGDKFAYYGNIVQYMNDDPSTSCAKSCVFHGKTKCDNVVCKISVYHGGYYKFLEIGMKINSERLNKLHWPFFREAWNSDKHNNHIHYCMYYRVSNNRKYIIGIMTIINESNSKVPNKYKMVIMDRDNDNYILNSIKSTRIRFMQEIYIFLDKHKDLLNE